MTPKVSIIIPVFNVERYLRECIASAVNQDYENIEIIIVDDGSNDGSSLIIEKFENSYSIINSIRIKNQGQSAARNIGLKIATGDYILFLDGDDWLESDTVSKCIRTCLINSLDIVLFGAKAFFDEDIEGANQDLNVLYRRAEVLNGRIVSSFTYLAEEIKLNNYIVSPCLYLYSRNKFKDLSFFPGIIHEDNLFTTQLLLAEESRVMSLCDRFYHRRFRIDSTMTRKEGVANVSGYLLVIDQLSLLYQDLRDSEKFILRKFITNLLGEILRLLRVVYGFNIPINIRKKMFINYMKYNSRPFNLNVLLKYLMPWTFGFYVKYKARILD